MAVRLDLHLATHTGISRVRVRTFMQAAQAAWSLFASVDAHLGGANADWHFRELSIGSLNASFEGEWTEAVGVIDPQEHFRRREFTIEESVVDGLTLLDERPSRPRAFDLRTVDAVRQLAALIGDEVSEITISAPAQQRRVVVTARAGINATEVLRRSFRDYGSVEGSILEVNINAKPPTFRIRHEGTGGLVTCEFSPELLNQVRAGLAQRVAVRGVLHYSADGIVTRVGNISDVVLLEPSRDLQVEDLADNMFPIEGMSAAEWLDRNWDEADY